MRGDNVAIPGLADLTEIGRGGFGVVYRATENELGREVAVKLLSGPLDERSRGRFERERRAMGVLSSHPNIITIFRGGTAATGEPYLVMEYLPGGSFADRLQRGPVDWPSAVAIGVELSGALESAHRAGVLHRDVKPGNIMVDGLGRAQLGDFGIARLDGSPETKSSVITASVAHAPPEVVAGDKPDERSDIYSLASTLFELISGSPAFVRSGDESMIPLFNRIVNEPVPDLRPRGVPDPLVSVLERAMAKTRGDRHPSAAAFGEALIEVQRVQGLSPSRLWVTDDGADPGDDQGGATRTVAPPPSADPSTRAPDGVAPPSTPPGPSPTPATPTPVTPASATPVPPTPGPGLPPPAVAPPGPAPGVPTPAPQGFAAPPAGGGYPAPGAPPPTGQPPVAPPPTGYPAPAGNPAPGTGYLPPPNAATSGPSPIHQPQPAPAPTRGSTSGRMWLMVAGAAVVAAVGLGLAISALGGQGDEQADGPRIDTFSDDPGDETTTTRGPTTTTSTTTTTTEPATPTAAPRSALLVDLPSLPVVEQPYGGYRTVSDPARSFVVDVPNEWVDALPTDGQVIVSPDNNAALADAAIPGGVVSGSQGIGTWDPDFFLDALIENAADADDPCNPVAREPYDDGVFDGLLYAEFCNGGDILVVSVLASDPNRLTVFLVSAQMTDERDMAAFQRMLDSFILLDPDLLPVVE